MLHLQYIYATVERFCDIFDKDTVEQDIFNIHRR